MTLPFHVAYGHKFRVSLYVNRVEGISLIIPIFDTEEGDLYIRMTIESTLDEGKDLAYIERCLRLFPKFCCDSQSCHLVCM